MRGCLIRQHRPFLQVESLAAGVRLRQPLLSCSPVCTSCLSKTEFIVLPKPASSWISCSGEGHDHLNLGSEKKLGTKEVAVEMETKDVRQEGEGESRITWLGVQLDVRQRIGQRWSEETGFFSPSHGCCFRSGFQCFHNPLSGLLTFRLPSQKISVSRDAIKNASLGVIFSCVKPHWHP